MSYNTNVNTFLGGISVGEQKRWKVKFDLGWNRADASLDPFRFENGEAWSASKPNQYYDFSQTNTYSDLDTTFWQAKLYGRYYVKKSLYVTAGYQYLDLQDDAPYLYDTSGSVDIYNFGVGWSFF